MSKDQPELHACIFHPRLRALKLFNVKDTKTGKLLQYGLCPICSNRLALQSSFKQDINDKLEEIMAKIQKKREELYATNGRKGVK